MFILTIAMGAVCGLVFDAFRVIRRSVRHKNIYTYLEDMLFWIIILFLFFYFLLHTAYGESLRFYFILGIFLGMLIYFLTASRIVIKLSMKAIAILKKVCSFLFKCFLKIIGPPIAFLKFLYGKVILFLTAAFFVPIRKLLKKTENYVKIKTKKPIKKLKRKIKKAKRKFR